MGDKALVVLVIGLFMFCVYWLIHGLISFRIYKDSAGRQVSSLGWVASYIGLSFLNMLIWAFVLLIPFLRFLGVGTENVLKYAVVSAALALFSVPSILVLLFYFLSSRGRIGVAGVTSAAEGTQPGMVARDAILENMGSVGLPQSISLYEEETTIGREPQNHVQITDDDGVSREHAKIKKTGNIYELIDRGSENGTFLNTLGDKVDREVLSNGDVIILGSRTKLRFRKTV